MKKTIGEHVADWIERWCLEPDSGKPVRLSSDQRTEILRIYDGNGQFEEIISGALGAYIALMHTCGPMAKRNEPVPTSIDVDIWSMWRAAKPGMQQQLSRRGDRILCPELGTSFPRAA
jgi:hypothetical protein